MANRKNRIPKKGDRVSAAGHEGAFIVYSVDGSIKVAELKQIGRDFAISTVPWNTLRFLDEEDASQAAARIVREATENH
jgi:hypothetical protein